MKRWFFLIFFSLILFFGFVPNVFAFDDLTYATFSGSNGTVISNTHANFSFNSYRHCRGVFPTCSTLISSANPSANTINVYLNNGYFNMEAGFVNGASNTPDANDYWVAFYSNSGFTGDTVHFTASRVSGIWYAGVFAIADEIIFDSCAPTSYVGDFTAEFTGTYSIASLTLWDTIQFEITRHDISTSTATSTVSVMPLALDNFYYDSGGIHYIS